MPVLAFILNSHSMCWNSPRGHFAQPASLIMSAVVDLTSVIWGSDTFYVAVMIKKKYLGSSSSLFYPSSGNVSQTALIAF